MVAKRRKVTHRRRAGHKRSTGIPAWFWLLAGILIGLGVALALMFKGYLPELRPDQPSADSQPAGSIDSPLVEAVKPAQSKPKKPRYDFFTVLPEMEVVVPAQELSRKAKPQTDSGAAKNIESYILQVGSFRNDAEAEQMKASLALLGYVATVQAVTVNGETWHRVRIGPFEGARKANEMRHLLSDNQFDTLVMKANP